MVLGKRKRQSGGKKPYGGGRPWKRRVRVWRPIRSRRIHNFTRSQYISAITVNPLTAYAGGFNFKLTDLSNYTEFTTLFDQFRINKIRLELLPLFTGNDANAQAGMIQLPFVHTAIDHNDSAQPTIDQLMQYPNYKRTRGHVVHKRYFTPAVAVMNYETVTTTAYTAQFNRWISTDDPATPHYGFKVFIDAPGANTTLSYRLFVKFYIQCKDQR